MKPVPVRLVMNVPLTKEQYELSWLGYIVTPGLAVCKTPVHVVGKMFKPAYRKWHIVHVPSGWRIGAEWLDFQSMTVAIAVAEELAKLVDWAKSPEELLKQEGLVEAGKKVIYGGP